MRSARFNRLTVLTRRASQRMIERNVTPELLLQVSTRVRCGTATTCACGSGWRCRARHDNLLCAVLVLEQAVIVQTVMHHWELMP